MRTIEKEFIFGNALRQILTQPIFIERAAKIGLGKQLKLSYGELRDNPPTFKSQKHTIKLNRIVWVNPKYKTMGIELCKIDKISHKCEKIYEIFSMFEWISGEINIY